MAPPKSQDKKTLAVGAGTEIILTPISPESKTYNESYVKIRNVRNEVGYESMDETDSQFPSPRTPNSDQHQLSVDGGNSSLQKVFCCAQNGPDNNSLRPTQLIRPGVAVQIITDASGSHTAKNPNVNTDLLSDKVGLSGLKSGTLLSTNNVNNEAHAKFKVAPPLPSPPCSPAVSSNGLKATDTDNDIDNWDEDSERLYSRRDSTARVSPSKSYSELVQFVFTEHGIKVISDREYVV